MTRSAYNQLGEQLVIDGTAEDGTYQGDGVFPPFVVFNVKKQENVAGPFESMGQAEIEMKRLAITGETHD